MKAEPKLAGRELTTLPAFYIPFLMTLFLIALLGIAIVYFVNGKGASQ